MTYARKICAWFACILAIAAASPGCSERDFSPAENVKASGDGGTDSDGGSDGKGGTEAESGTGIGGGTDVGGAIDLPGGAGTGPTKPGEAIFDVSAWDDGSYFAP